MGDHSESACFHLAPSYTMIDRGLQGDFKVKVSAKKVQSTAQLRRGSKVKFSRCRCKHRRFASIPCTCFAISVNKLQDRDFYKTEMEVVGLVKGRNYDKNVNVITPEEYEKQVEELEEKKRKDLQLLQIYRQGGRKAVERTIQNHQRYHQKRQERQQKKPRMDCGYVEVEM